MPTACTACRWPESSMFGWLKDRLLGSTASRELPDALWESTLAQFPFLADRPAEAVQRLRLLTRQFLRHKQFHGANGLEITDAMAVAIAAQACLPVLNLRHGWKPLAWYDDFVGIVLHPGEVVAQREATDPAGVVHRWREVIAGEAMHRGPVMLSWQDVALAGTSVEQGYNVVVHEFVHKIDMRDGGADGCPPLPPGFMGWAAPQIARTAWLGALGAAYDDFREKVILAERFGAERPWLNPYGAESIVEFFAVACEAYFVNRSRFGADFAALLPLFDAFFQPDLP